MALARAWSAELMTAVGGMQDEVAKTWSSRWAEEPLANRLRLAQWRAAYRTYTKFYEIGERHASS